MANACCTFALCWGGVLPRASGNVGVASTVRCNSRALESGAEVGGFRSEATGEVADLEATMESIVASLGDQLLCIYDGEEDGARAPLSSPRAARARLREARWC